MVQWLRLHAFNAGDKGSVPGLGIKIPHDAQCSQKKKKKKLSFREASGLILNSVKWSGKISNT